MKHFAIVPAVLLVACTPEAEPTDDTDTPPSGPTITLPGAGGEVSLPDSPDLSVCATNPPAGLTQSQCERLLACSATESNRDLRDQACSIAANDSGGPVTPVIERLLAQCNALSREEFINLCFDTTAQGLRQTLPIEPKTSD